MEECAAHVVEAVRVIENERERLRRDLQRRSEVRAFVGKETQCVAGMAMVEVATPMQQQPAFPQPAATRKNENARARVADERVEFLNEPVATDECVAVVETDSAAQMPLEFRFGADEWAVARNSEKGICPARPEVCEEDLRTLRRLYRIAEAAIDFPSVP